VIVPVAVVCGHLFPHDPASTERLLFLAIVPGLDEELIFRGILLPLFNQAMPPRWRFAGAEVGWGLIAVTILFGAIHGVHVDRELTIAFDLTWGTTTMLPGALYAYLVSRTGSLLFPVLCHNVGNVMLFALG
jgi:membrane protease YdiL (CAAX protease family)